MTTLTRTEMMIRRASHRDIAELSDLIEKSFRILASRDYNRKQMASALKYVVGLDTRLIDDGTYYAVEIDDKIVGCGGWSRCKELIGYGQSDIAQKEGVYIDPSKEAAKIRAFFVHPCWARRGIGSKLMNSCETAAKKAGFTKLELLATLTGEPLYLHCGFDVIERVDVKLPDGVITPAIKMSKVIG